MNETVASAVVGLGSLLVLIGWVWLLIAAFRHRILWGLAVFLFPPAALVFLFVSPRARAPVGLMLLGFVVIAGTVLTSNVADRWVSKSPVTTVEKGTGERDLILNDAANPDYAKELADKTYTKLLMANKDVTDDTLEHLRGMDRLKELDLDNTQITDKGLAIVASLPKLETLRLRNTAITDAGFKEHLAGKDTLMELDLRGTKVDRATFAAWKAAKPDRRGFR